MAVSHLRRRDVLQVLKILEAKFQKLQYSPAQATAVLNFETESVRIPFFVETLKACAEFVHELVHVVRLGAALQERRASASIAASILHCFVAAALPGYAHMYEQG